MHLKDYIESLQGKGQLWFSRSEALSALGCSALALGKAASYLARQKKLVLIKPDFFIIVPVEYRSWGIIPPDQFIDPLMSHLEIPYYIGLLSAAEIHGAAHQRPQQYQVMANHFKYPIKKERVQIKFFLNHATERVPTQKITVKTGYLKVSTPEITALDLVKHYKYVGFFNNVGTVLAELLEKINAETLSDMINRGWYDITVIQRLGYLLSSDAIGGQAFAEPLIKVIERKKPRYTPLNPSVKGKVEKKDKTWRILVNDEVDIDV